MRLVNLVKENSPGRFTNALLVGLLLFTSVLNCQLSTARAQNNPSEMSAHSPFTLKATWKDDKNNTVKIADWKDQFTVLTMSYTACKRICPQLTTSKLKEIEEHLIAKGIKAHYVIVTFDPENDTPQTLAEYKTKLNVDKENWHFLTGSMDDTKQLAALLGLSGFFKMDDHIIHDFRIELMNSTGQTSHLDWKHRDVDAALKGLY
jgi:protein SCO1/2